MTTPKRLTIYTDSVEMHERFTAAAKDLRVENLAGVEFVWTSSSRTSTGVQANLTEISRVKTEWTGEGLPPVGTVCEIRAHKLTNWDMAKIEFAFRNVVVWGWMGEPSMNGLCTAYAHEVEFRPVRTPEQIAEEERENAVLIAMGDTRTLGISDNSKRILIERLYDAGYRKQPTDQ
jgi:hypothetical protein